MSKVADFQQRVAAATGASEAPKMPEAEDWPEGAEAKFHLASAPGARNAIAFARRDPQNNYVGMYDDEQIDQAIWELVEERKLQQSKVELDVPGTGFLCFDGRPILAVGIFSDGSLNLVGSDIGDSFTYRPKSDEWSFRFGETKRHDFDFEHSLEVRLIDGNSDDGADDRWTVSDHTLQSSTWLDLVSVNAADRKMPESRNQVAEGVYQRYEFGEGVEVEDASGWEYTTGSSEWTRPVFVEVDQGDDGPKPTEKLTLTVRFNADDNTVAEAYAIDTKGQIWGQLPAAEPVLADRKMAENGPVNARLWVAAVGHELVPGTRTIAFFQAVMPTDKEILARFKESDDLNEEELAQLEVEAVFDLNHSAEYDPGTWTALKDFSASNSRLTRELSRTQDNRNSTDVRVIEVARRHGIQDYQVRDRQLVAFVESLLGDHTHQLGNLSTNADFSPFIERLSGRVVLLHTMDSDETFVIPPGVTDRKWLMQESVSAKREAASLFERAQQLSARAKCAELAADLCEKPDAESEHKPSSPSPRM